METRYIYDRYKISKADISIGRLLEVKTKRAKIDLFTRNISFLTLFEKSF